MNAVIKNGDLDILLSGSVIVQNLQKPLTFNLTLPNDGVIDFSIEFEIVEDMSDAKAITSNNDTGNTTSLKLKIPKDVSLMHVIGTPLIDLDDQRKVFLAIGYTTSRDGEVKFDYTFSSSPGVISPVKKVSKDK